MACNFITDTNKNTSILGETILKDIAKGNEEYAKELLNHFKTPYFMSEVFGDYVQSFEDNYENDKTGMISRIDDNGEPLLLKNNTNGKFYYIDKNQEKIFFPFSEQGLSAYFKSTELRDISSTLALQFYKETNKQDDSEDFKLSLNNFIKNFIQDKANEIYEDNGSLNEDYSRAEKMERLLEYSDEIVDKVKNFFTQINFEISEDSEFVNEDVEARDYNFSKASNETNKDLDIRSGVRLMLSLLEDTQKKESLFKLNKFVAFKNTYSTLINELGDVVPVMNFDEQTGKTEIEDIFELYLDKIQELSKVKPEFKDLYLKLRDLPEHQQNHFIKAFYVQNQDMIITNVESKRKELYRSEDGKAFYRNVKTFTSRNLKVTDSANQKVRLEWSENFKNLLYSKEGKLNPNAISIVNSVVSQIEDIRNSDNDVLQKSKLLIESLKNIGLTVSEKGMESYLTNNKDVIVENEVNTKIQGLYVALDNLNRNLESINDFRDVFSKFFELSKLAETESKFVEQRADANVRVKDKARYTFSNMSYLKNKISTWKKSPALLRQHIQEKQYYKGSVIGRYLLGLGEKITQAERDRRLGKLNMSTFLGLKYKDTIESSEMPFSDYYVDSLNKLLKGSEIRTITPADKNLDYQMTNGYTLESTEQEFSFDGDSDLKLSNETVSIFRMYFFSELNRINEATDELNEALKSGDLSELYVHYHIKSEKFDKLLKHYNETGEIDRSLTGNAFKSQLFPSLSYGEDNAIKHKIYDENGRPNSNFLAVRNWFDYQSTNNSSIDSFIREELNKITEEQHERLLKEGIFSLEDDGSYTNNLIDNDVYQKYQDRLDELSGEDFVTKSEKISKMIASDSIINGIIQNIEYSKLYVGDIAYYKDAVDFKKRIPASYTDGLQLRIKPGQEYFKVAIIESVKIKSPEMEHLIEILGEDEAMEIYGNINSADAQSWITPARWKFLVNGVGNWTDKHDSVYDKMTNGKNESYTKEELKLLASPLKGVYFDINEGVPVYLKYSQAVLTPSLVKGNIGLEKVLKQMNEKNIDELITFDGIKVGAKKPTRLHNEKGNILDEFELNPMVLKNSGWKLQQDLPTKGIKETSLGSQIQKNIFAGLIPYLDKNDVMFDYQGKEQTASEILNHIVSNTKSLSDSGLSKLKSRFKIGKDGKINDISGFYDTLIEELVKRGSSDNVIDALRKETALVGIPQAQGKIMNVFASMFLNNVVKIKTNGGSFIQMSNFGLSKNEAVEQGVIMSPKMENGKTTAEPRYYTDENGRKKLRPGQIFISGSFIAKYIPDYKTKKPEELFGYTNEQGEFIPGLIDNDILESIIGYRIPNQGLSSNDALEIIGILPEEQGDTIIAYTGITAKTGSDFDVDKMYFMMKSFVLNNGRLEISNEGDDVYKNNLVDLYKSVLTNTEVIKDIMKSIDDDLIKNEINKLTENDTSRSLHHFDPYYDTKLKYDFIKGKAGVGQEANVTVDINRPGKLSLIDYNVGWGHKNSENETILDELYSEELSDSEIEDYMKLMGISEKDKKKFISKVKKVSLNTSITSILNGFVDIAKDPFITRGNWNTFTTNTGNLLLRSGMHPLKVINFLAQPVITEYLELQDSKEGSFGDDAKDTMNTFVNNKFQEFVKEEDKVLLNGKRLGLDQLFKKVMYKTPESLKEAMIILNSYNSLDKVGNLFGVKSIKPYLKILNIPVDERTVDQSDFLIDNEDSFNDVQMVIEGLREKVKSFMKIGSKDLMQMNLIELRDQHKNTVIGTQLQILNKFKELQKISKNLGKVMNLMKVDTNGFGKDINGIFTAQYLYSELLSDENNKVKGSVRGVKERLENSITGVYYDNVIKEVSNIVKNNPKLFPQGKQNVVSLFNNISHAVLGENLKNEKLIKLLQDSFYSNLMGEFFKENTNLGNKEYTSDLLSNFPSKLQSFLLENKGKYLITDELKISSDEISMTSRNKSVDYQNDLVNSWKDLLNDFPTIGKELVYYSYLKSSFQMKQGQFFTLIPHEFFINEDINSFVNSFSGKDKEDLTDFIDKFFLNNVENEIIIPTLKDGDFTSEKGEFNNLIYLTKYKTIKPFVKIQEEYLDQNNIPNLFNKIYKYEGDYFDADLNKSLPIYTRINKATIVKLDDIQNYLNTNDKYPINTNRDLINKFKKEGLITSNDLFNFGNESDLIYKEDSIKDINESKYVNLSENKPTGLPSIDKTDDC